MFTAIPRGSDACPRLTLFQFNSGLSRHKDPLRRIHGDHHRRYFADLCRVPVVAEVDPSRPSHGYHQVSGALDLRWPLSNQYSSGIGLYAGSIGHKAFHRPSSARRAEHNLLLAGSCYASRYGSGSESPQSRVRNQWSKHGAWKHTGLNR